MAKRPSIFISYSHADAELARELANGLEAADHRIWIDEGEILTGESLIEKIATAIAEVDFLLALITEASVQSSWCQKELALAITGELGREGIRVLPVRVGDVALPPSLRDQKYLRLDPANIDAAIGTLIADIGAYASRDATASAAGRSPAALRSQAAAKAAGTFEPIAIVGLVEEGVGKPRNDGTRRSALYRVPLRLSRTPSSAWARHFEETWDHPPRFTAMHRPGICKVVGDTVVLDGTTIEELEEVHLPTLRLVLDKVNNDIAQYEAQERAAREQAEAEAKAHDEKVREAAKRLDFGAGTSDPTSSDLLPEQEELLARLVEGHNSKAPDRPMIRITRFKGRAGVRIFLKGKSRGPLDDSYRPPFGDFAELRAKGYLRQVEKTDQEIIYSITPDGFARAATIDSG